MGETLCRINTGLGGLCLAHLRQEVQAVRQVPGWMRHVRGLHMSLTALAHASLRELDVSVCPILV